ncbi:MAG: hypothetical protein IPG66_11855 [Hydrogenophilales bacterium]|nr:hypothetical protein [Hydrogenophilales bacterium]
MAKADSTTTRKEQASPITPSTCRPELAVVKIHHHPNQAVISELQGLLFQAITGKIIGLGCVVVGSDQVLSGSLAGTLSKDSMKASAAFLRASVRTANGDFTAGGE